MGLEPTILVFERAKTFDALDCAATLISSGGMGSRIINLGTCWKRSASNPGASSPIIGG
jgi:hypothetical protein